MHACMSCRILAWQKRVPNQRQVAAKSSAGQAKADNRRKKKEAREADIQQDMQAEFDELDAITTKYNKLRLEAGMKPRDPAKPFHKAEAECCGTYIDRQEVAALKRFQASSKYAFHGFLDPRKLS